MSRQYIRPRHADCVHYTGGFCGLYGVRVNPDSPACPNFVPKVKNTEPIAVRSSYNVLTRRPGLNIPSLWNNPPYVPRLMLTPWFPPLWPPPWAMPFAIPSASVLHLMYPLLFLPPLPLMPQCVSLLFPPLYPPYIPVEAIINP